MQEDENERITTTMPSLFKLACVALPPGQYLEVRKKYKGLKIDVQHCCKLLTDIIKKNSADGVFNPFGEKRYLFEKLKDLPQSNWAELICSTVQHGHMDCLKIAHEFGCPLRLHKSNLFSHDFLDFMRKYMNDRLKVHKSLCNIAAYHGQLECLDYAANHGVEVDVFTGLSAVLGDSIECLTYAVEKGCPLTNPVLKEAAAYKGNLQILKYLHEKECPWSIQLNIYAFYHGHMECLEYAHDNGCPWGTINIDMAIKTGNLKIFKCVAKDESPIDYQQTIEIAALAGQLTIIKYLHEQGAPWSVKTCTNAAEEGHLECLKYLRANGCPWDESTCIEAARGGHFECLKYIVDNGCPKNSTKPAEDAARYGDFSALKYLHEHGWPWSTRTCTLAAVYKLKSVKYEHLKNLFDGTRIENPSQCLIYAWKNGCPWSDGTCLAGSGDGRMDCLQSEPDHKCMWDSEEFGGQAAIIRNRKLVGRLKGPITPALLEPLLLKCIEKIKITV